MRAHGIHTARRVLAHLDLAQAGEMSRCRQVQAHFFVRLPYGRVEIGFARFCVATREGHLPGPPTSARGAQNEQHLEAGTVGCARPRGRRHLAQDAGHCRPSVGTVIGEAVRFVAIALMNRTAAGGQKVCVCVCGGRKLDTAKGLCASTDPAEVGRVFSGLRRQLRTTGGEVARGSCSRRGAGCTSI